MPGGVWTPTGTNGLSFRAPEFSAGNLVFVPEGESKSLALPGMTTLKLSLIARDSIIPRSSHFYFKSLLLKISTAPAMAAAEYSKA